MVHTVSSLGRNRTVRSLRGTRAKDRWLPKRRVAEGAPGDLIAHMVFLTLPAPPSMALYGAQTAVGGSTRSSTARPQDLTEFAAEFRGGWAGAGFTMGGITWHRI